MARRILLAAALFAFPVSLLAQNDFGVWVNRNSYSSTTASDSTIAGSTFHFKVDSRTGYGVTFNHFSGPNVSTEFGVSEITGDATASIDSPAATFRAMINTGRFRANVASAVMKWNWAPKSFFSPYLGAGAAYFINGRVDSSIDPNIVNATSKLENHIGYVIDGGINLNLTHGIAIGIDLRHSPYKTKDKNDPNTHTVNLDPTTLALGIRFHM